MLFVEKARYADGEQHAHRHHDAHGAEELSAGTKMNSASIRITGATAIFQFLETNTTPSPPKRAGRICAKAGASTGAFEDRGQGRDQHARPGMMMTVVTMLETAMATVETISPSSVLDVDIGLLQSVERHGELQDSRCCR